MSRARAGVMALIIIWVMAWMLNSACAGGYQITPHGEMLFYPQSDRAPVRQYFDAQGNNVGYGVRHDDRMILRHYDGSATEVWRDEHN